MWINELELEKLLSLCPFTTVPWEIHWSGKNFLWGLLWTEISRDWEISCKKSEISCESHWEEDVSLADGNKWRTWKRSRCAATLSRFLVAEVTQVVLRDFGSSGFEAMRRLPANTFSIWGYREQQNNDRSLKLTRGHDNESLLVYGLQMVYTKLRVHSTVERARVCNVKCNAI